MKCCSRCGETKPLSEFHRNVRSRDGFHCACRACKRVADRASYQRHREARARTAKAWAAANKDKRKQIARDHARRKYAPIKQAVAERRAMRRAEAIAKTEKQCSVCRTVRPTSDFGPHKRTLDRLRPDCYDCQRANCRSRYHDDIEHARKLGRESAKRSREQITDYYAAARLGLSPEQAGPELLELERTNLKLKRLLRGMK